MDTVTVSSRYQIVIPQRIRTTLGIQPGQRMQVIAYEDRIELVPVKPVKEARGFLKGIDTRIERQVEQA